MSHSSPSLSSLRLDDATRATYPAHALHTVALAASRNIIGHVASDSQSRLPIAKLVCGHGVALQSLGYKTLPSARRLLTKLRKVEAMPPRALPWPSGAMGRNLRRLAKALALDATEASLLKLALALETYPGFSAFLEDVVNRAGDGMVLLALAIGEEPLVTRKALSQRGRLVASGLVTSHELAALPVDMPRGLVESLMNATLSLEELIEEILPVAAPQSLDLSDFEHLGDELRVLRRLLEGAVRERAPGVNILLHGPTGAGKTALAAVIARAIGAVPYVAGKESRSGGDIDAEERLSSLLMGQRLLAHCDAVLVFDEFEDLFEPAPMRFDGRRSSQATMSKQFFNTMLETNAVPTVWITNTVEDIDPAYRRRFSLAIELRAPGLRQREKVVHRIAGQLGIVLSDEEVRRTARHEVSAAQLATSLRATVLACGGYEAATAELVLQRSEQLVSMGAAPVATAESGSYRLDVLVTSVSLERLVEGLSHWKPGRGPGPSLLLSGLPGTGKSEFARQLAKRLDREVHQVRCSDLLGMYVGQTEAALAEAFRRAAADDALLLFDEADSFLGDRADARQRWEITGTNEFLQQLERHPGLVACTTNRVDALDPAALRRFSHKVEFHPLRREGALALLQDAVVRAGLEASTLTVDALDGVDSLTPGDFAAVERRMNQLGGARSVDEVVEALRDEVQARTRNRRVGFGG